MVVSAQRAFSLVELSIVLVILGLLVGGVLSGQSLIRASEMRTVTEQISTYQTAINSFRDKYFALPGDMTNATAFWGKNNTLCPTASGTAATPGTCNGNGDGMIGTSTKGATEMFIVWQHLADAGLISGSYSGVVGSGGTYDAIAGTNVPAGRLSGVGFGLLACVGWGTAACSTDYYVNTHNTLLTMGAKLPGDMYQVAFLKPSEAWNIDTKVDDGKPGTGNYHVYPPSSVAVLQNTNCATNDDPSLAIYNLSYDSIGCSLVVGF